MIEILRKRRSIRRFKNRLVESEKIELLKEAVLRSPSSRNLDPCQFIFVDDKQCLEKLSLCKPHGAAFLKNAALGVVVCADESQSDVWIEDSSIASILVQLTAQSLELGSCWIQIRKRNYTEDTSSQAYIRGVLNVPDDICILSIIAIGYPVEQLESVPKDQLKHQKIRKNHW